MAHTDKDAPNWVRALNNPHARIHHSWLCENSPHGLARAEHRRPCDLDNPLDRRSNRCFRYVHDRSNWYTGVGPNRLRRHLSYYGPERATVRDTLRDAVRDYNTFGNTEVDPPTRQTRSSDWYGGWWD